MGDNTAVRESTAADYWRTLNPSAAGYLNPELKFNAATDSVGDLGFDSEDFQSYYKDADGATKKAMLQANNKADAIKIAERRDLFTQSQEAIAQDGVLTQLGMGLIPSLASPSSLLPVGAVFKGAQLAKTASRLRNAALFGATGAGTGAAANIVDESLFDLQGMPTNYVGAAGAGILFGGGLGMLGGALVGPTKGKVANNLSTEKDTWTKDFEQDNNIEIQVDDNGIPKLIDITNEVADVGQMEKSFIDRIPFLGKVLKSDVHTVYQGNSPLLRGFMMKLASPSVSLKDSKGNIIPSPKNALNIKKEADGFYNNLTVGVSDAFEEARVNNYNKSRDTFNQEVWEVYAEAMNRQKREAVEYANTKTLGMRTKDITDAERNALLKSSREAMDEFYTNSKIDFKGDPSLVKGAEAYRKYFQDMLDKSQKLGIKELKGININKLYAPRTYDFKAIHTGKVTQETVRAEIKAGLANDASNGHMTGEELEIATESILKMLNETSFDLNHLSTSYMVVKDLPFSTNLKAKKLYLNESYMPSILKSNFEDISGAYHYKMSGRQGIQYAFGTDDLSEVSKLVKDEHLKQGILYNKDEIQAFESVVKDIVGDLRMNQLADTPAWTWTRNISGFNSLRLGGGFGGNQFIELASSVMMNGVRALFSGRMITSLNNVRKLLYSKTNDADDFAKYLIASGHMEDALHQSRINRYADTESGFNSGIVENGLNHMNDKMMKWNGMRYFMGVMEDYTGGAIVTQLKEGNLPIKRLARWGLTKEDAANLGIKLKEVTKDNGWDLSSLSIKEQDQLQLAISRGIEEIVVQGDSIHLPRWAKTLGPVGKLFFQFYRFPLIAQETLLRTGMNEEQSKLVAGVVGSIFTYISLKALREQAAISLGTLDEADAKYDYNNFDEEDWTRVIGESLNYTAPLGFMGQVYNYGAIATGNNELGRAWTDKKGVPSLVGPTGGAVEDFIQVIRAAVSGDIKDERTLKRAKHLIPFNNLPIVNEGLNKLAEEYGD